MIRKIETREEIERKKKRNQIVVGGVLIVLMVVSTAGYSLIRNDDEGGGNKVSEFGLDFVRNGGYWRIEIGGGVFGFQNLPSDVENVSVNGSYSFDSYVGKPLYFVGGNEGVSEILVNLGGYVLRYQSACLNESGSCEEDLPVKNCDSNLIIFEAGNETSVWGDENCVYIVGDGVKGADAFLYKSLKII